jgi:large subunit ribosomal protein L19
MDLVATLEKREPNPGVPSLSPGDRVKVHLKIIEGDRERIQVFQGVVMRLRRGGSNANFTVRRVAAHGVGVERTFLIHSPRIDKVEVLGHAHVRRAQLYYLRERRGKASRLREKRIVETGEPTEAAAE